MEDIFAPGKRVRLKEDVAGFHRGAIGFVAGEKEMHCYGWAIPVGFGSSTVSIPWKLVTKVLDASHD